MNRKDTILIAVLLNAGLLIVLFATSVKSDKTGEAVPTTVLSSSQPEMQSALAPVAAAPTAAAGSDQLDQVIQQYVTPQVPEKVPEKVIGQTVQTETQANFLADLQALGTDPAATPGSVGSVMENAPAALEMQPVEPALREVKVKKGDVLEKIARQNQVSVNEIMKANKLSSTRLKIGQILKIPGKIAKTAIASSDNAQYYTIKNGDNPWTIAVKHHMKVDELLKLNNMNEDKARRLKPGDRIRIQ